ncbi:MAG: hypothetical protein EXR79_05450 [Myxococcales bacterium]|nr:hypothetical protein [Myxococcales bacterium]
MSTIAGNGNGYKDGPVTEAQFQSPFGVGRDRAGNLYVSEQVGRIRKITPARVVSTLASNLSMTAGTDGGGGTAAGSGGAVGGPCQDGVACTASDVCGGDGKCAPGKSKACNDGDDCTTDACDTLTGGCLNTPVAGCF